MKSKELPSFVYCLQFVWCAENCSFMSDHTSSFLHLPQPSGTTPLPEPCSQAFSSPSHFRCHPFFISCPGQSSSLSLPRLHDFCIIVSTLEQATSCPDPGYPFKSFAVAGVVGAPAAASLTTPAPARRTCQSRTRSKNYNIPNSLQHFEDQVVAGAPSGACQIMLKEK